VIKMVTAKLTGKKKLGLTIYLTEREREKYLLEKGDMPKGILSSITVTEIKPRRRKKGLI